MTHSKIKKIKKNQKKSFCDIPYPII